MSITYTFGFDDGRSVRIDVDIERAAVGADPAASGELPRWTELHVHQCPNCPLAGSQTKHCPAAADLAPTISQLGQVISYQKARVKVELLDRTVEKTGQLQDALSSLMGLIMATSACPILGRMRGLARTHLPFATHEETLLRAVGAYLIRMFIDGGKTNEVHGSLDALKAHYASLEQLNRAFRARLRSAAPQDAALNAVSSLGVLSLGIGASIEDQLHELEAFVFDRAAVSG